MAAPASISSMAGSDALKLPAVKGASPKPEVDKNAEPEETCLTSDFGLRSDYDIFERLESYPPCLSDGFDAQSHCFELPQAPEFPDADPDSERQSLASIRSKDADVCESEDGLSMCHQLSQVSRKFSEKYMHSLVAEFEGAAPTVCKEPNRFGKTLSTRSAIHAAPLLEDAESPSAPTAPPPAAGIWKGIQKTRKMLSSGRLGKADDGQQLKQAAPVEPVAPESAAPAPRWMNLRKSRGRLVSAATEASAGASSSSSAA